MQTARGASLSDEHDPPTGQPDDPAPPVPPVRRPWWRVGGSHPVIFIGMAVFVIVVDQVSKALAMHELADGMSRPLIGNFLKATLTRNSGAAFSSFTSATWLITVAVTIVSVAVLVVSSRLGSRWWALAFGLLLGGALGNLADRLFRDPGFGTGHVVDFLQLPHWPIFNLADSSVVAAAVLIVLLTLLGRTLDGKRAR